MARVKQHTKQKREAARPLHAFVGYGDCLAGRAPVPQDTAGKLLFQFLMVGGMVTFMATFNGMRHSGINFFFTHHWIYPLVACVALFLRLAFTSRLVDFLAPKFILGHFKAPLENILMALLNIAIMTPLMTCVITLILYGTTNYWFNVADNIVWSIPVALLINVLIVAPIVKMVYNNFFTTERGLRALNTFERDALPWMYIFNS